MYGSSRKPLSELAALFLRLGATAFGGPAVHTALMREDVVVRRKWLNDSTFLELVAACNLIPGPNSTELAMHIGYLRAGWWGLVVAGMCFILPAMCLVMALSAAYVHYGQVPQVDAALWGIKPVAIAIVIHALLCLGNSALRRPDSVVLLLISVVALLMGNNELLTLGLIGVASAILRHKCKSNEKFALAIVPIGAAANTVLYSAPFKLSALFSTFFKIGAVLYGSGYVLLAFLRADFVERLHWLTDQQVLDAFVIGQLTPGPLFTTATAIGYMLGGASGAVLATVAIFLPAFLFVSISAPFLARLRAVPTLKNFLEGVSLASLGIMGFACWKLGRVVFVSPLSLGLTAASLAVLLLLRINPTWLIVAGAVIGMLHP